MNIHEDLVDKILTAKLNEKGDGAGNSAGNSAGNNGGSLATSHGFIGMCSHCHRKMTSETSFNRHIRTQVCVDKHLRTYCKICDEVMDSRELYTKHIITREHVAKIMATPVDTLDFTVLRKERKKRGKNSDGSGGGDRSVEAQIVSKMEADPYLDRNDKDSMAPTELTIVFGGGVGGSGGGGVGGGSGFSDCGSDIGSIGDVEMSVVAGTTPVIRQITERQQKVLVFLKSIIGAHDAANKFLVVLNKLGLDDYQGLGLAIIQCDEIPLASRQVFIGVISKYKELLQKKMIGGKPTHNGVDINLIVASLNF